MNRLTLLLVTAALLSSCLAQPAKTPVNPTKSIQAGPLQITPVNTEYGAWQSPVYSLGVSAWGVRVRIANTTDKEVSESFDGADLKIADASGKQYGISDQYASIYKETNLMEMNGQGLTGVRFYAGNGLTDALIIRSGDTEIGEISRTIIDTPKMQNNYTIQYTIQLAPRKSVTLVFVFDSPREIKPVTLFWPKAKPIDLR